MSDARRTAELEAQVEDEGLNPQLDVEGIERELQYDDTATLMSTPPGPLKASTRLPYTERCPSGLSELDADA